MCVCEKQQSGFDVNFSFRYLPVYDNYYSQQPTTLSDSYHAFSCTCYMNMQIFKRYKEIQYIYRNKKKYKRCRDTKNTGYIEMQRNRVRDASFTVTVSSHTQCYQLRWHKHLRSVRERDFARSTELSKSQCES